MKEIPLTRGKVALVDDEDYERLVAMGKFQYADGYAMKSKAVYRNNKRSSESIRMHRFIMGIDNRDCLIDHKDGDKLNNQKYNLRVASNAENLQNRGKQINNTSGFKGVTLRKNRWQARIGINQKRIHLGYFVCPIEAARAYNAAAIKHHGEFAKLNQL